MCCLIRAVSHTHQEVMWNNDGVVECRGEMEDTRMNSCSGVHYESHMKPPGIASETPR
jgi:hypothetical protein